MFERVPFDELIQGEEYKIQLPNANYKGTYDSTTFDGYYRCVGLTDISKHKKYTSLCFSRGYVKFYRFVPQKDRIQNAMEQRAVNKMVGEIIGDPCFMWV